MSPSARQIFCPQQRKGALVSSNLEEKEQCIDEDPVHEPSYYCDADPDPEFTTVDNIVADPDPKFTTVESRDADPDPKFTTVESRDADPDPHHMTKSDWHK